jgi:hypothetical protein
VRTAILPKAFPGGDIRRQKRRKSTKKTIAPANLDDYHDSFDYVK